MSQEFRIPLPDKIGPGMSATIPNFRPPKSKKFSDEEMSEISERLMNYLKDEEEQTTKVPDKKKSKQEQADERRLLTALYPDTNSAKKRSFWHHFKFPLDQRFSETYVTAGFDRSGNNQAEESEKMNLASFVRKTKDLLLNEEVLKEVEAAAPGDQIQTIEPKLGRKALKKVKKAEREKTKGSDWFHMKAPEMTPELQNELDVLKMRSAIDPTRFYKRADAATQPKYFQIGHVVDSPVDYYSDRVTKKDRKKNFVDELLADAEFQKFSKRKYVEIISEKSKTQHRKRFKKSGSSKKSAAAGK